MKEEVLQKESIYIEEIVNITTEAAPQEPTSTMGPMEEDRPSEERLGTNEVVSTTTEATPQEPTSIMEPMEEDGLGKESPEAEETMGPTEGETMDIMDGVDTVIHGSTFINVVLEGTISTPSTQEMSNTGDGVTQEPPRTHLAPGIQEESNLEVDAIQQEPVSTIG